MNRAQRRRSRIRSKSFFLGASLATGALVGYVGYSRVLPAFASTTCVVNDNGTGAGDSTNKTFAYCLADTNVTNITFDSSISRITMDFANSSGFEINRSLTVDGISGRSSRMVFNGDGDDDGYGDYRILDVSEGPVTLTGLVIENAFASAGGAVYGVDLSGDVDFVLEDVNAYSNRSTSVGGGFLHTDGDVTISGTNSFKRNSALSVSGGVIYAAGDVTVSGTSTFESNKASSNGGAIYASGTVTVSGASTFTNNRSYRYGGAIYANIVDFQAGTIDYNSSVTSFGSIGAIDGGGIYAKSSVTISGGTFRGLEASRYGGTVFSSGTVTVSGSPEFDANEASSGGAVYSDGDIQVSGSPEFKNNDVIQYGGALFSRGNVTVGGTASFTGNAAGSYGGAIYAASTKRITINDTPVFTSNTAGAAGGALEAPTVEITGASTFTSNVAGTSGGGAVSSALVTVSGDATFTSNSSQFRGGAIRQSSSSSMTISGDAKFYNNGNTDANSISYVTQYGGAVYANGNISVSGNVIFSGNYALNHGGGLFTRSDLDISGGGSFTNNEASNYGGAIYAEYLTSNASTLSFVGNEATKGGAIYVRYTTSLTGNHTFTNNSATADGGAVCTRDFTLTSTSGNESVFDNNDAGTSGGAIYASSDLRVTFAEFRNADATNGDGGAIYVGSDATISNSTFTSNTAGSSGGAVSARNSFDIDDSTFTSNSAIKGGALSMPMSFTTSYIDTSTFTSNHATSGRGGAIYTTSSALDITSVIFDNNSSLLAGGAVYGGQDVTLKSSTFTSNSSSSSSAGAVYSSNTTNVTGSYFYNNQANRSGGAISSWTTITVNDSLFNSNTAGANYNGGGIYSQGRAYVYNSTLYKNSAGSRGSAIFGDRSSVLNFVTVYKNYITNYANDLDAAVYLGTGYTYNSIISGNVNFGTSTGLDFRVAGTAHAHNTLFTADGTALGGNGDYVNNAYAAQYSYGGDIYFGSPRLSALADNGGPTKTLKPRFGSPAIDTAQSSFTQPAAGQPLRFDQRGELRVFGSAADLGAVELQSVPTAAQFTITVSAGANGSISPSGNQTVNELSDNTFTVTPNAGYKIASVTVDGVSQTVTDTSTFSYSFDDAEQNHSIAATFEPITHTITVSQGANGTIAPSTKDVNQGLDQTFTVTPDAGYKIASVRVDGVSQTVSDSSAFSYTFTGVNATGTISATFEAITHTITVTQGANGTISPDTTTVNQGSDQTFTVSPDAGYQIASVSVNGNDQTINDPASFSFDFINVNQAGTIVAIFEEEPSAPAPAPENNSGGASVGSAPVATVEAVGSKLDSGQVIEIDANKEETVLFTGTGLDLVDSVMMGDTDLSFEVSDSSEQITVTIPASVAGEIKVEFFFGKNKIEQSVMVKEAISPSVVNAGSFKGVVAIYAKNFEGRRLSAKVGKDWVVVDKLDSNFVRVVEPVRWVGQELAVRIFIDRKLVRTVRLITK